ncbi:MAG: glycosyltransferase family 9 protein [Ignavibacterium album]|jgi:heptosyltransferase-2|uniref:Glycosyltransferase family 9 protein n=1 Tax=Ignavibacterium album TaxID=591197 RepID=A0A7V2ZL95_9BACT|nr:glycosyltransferase family 9 protein [Ignavibacterium album]MCX8105114.1 glycosyltransferase family 9 protein [Ignavibacterium album]
MVIKNDCFHFKGDIPCLPHKKYGFHCDSCDQYKKIEHQFLIIKLGAIGDVIRTTPILRKIRKEFPNAYIYWLTYSPEILSDEWVNKKLQVNVENIELIKQIEFDWLIVLDKDPLAISLSNQIKAKRKSGFTIDKFGRPAPISTEAEEHKWLTGIFDDISKKNQKSYPEEMFDIIGFGFSDEEYIVEVVEKYEWNLDYNKKIIGLNTGCGGRWSSRLWPNEYWVDLAVKLKNNGYEVVFIGGEQEHSKNLELASLSGCKYFGHFELKKFTSLMNEFDLIVTAVTMAMHLAIGLKKKVLIFNTIFNKNEFYLYGRGEIIEPEEKCDCYYSPVCPHDSMKKITPDKVVNAIEKLLK